MRVELDPGPAARLDALHEHDPTVADRLEECLDWIEAEPWDMRARRRQFSNGMKAITRRAGGRDGLILWEADQDGVAVIRFLDQTSTL